MTRTKSCGLGLRTGTVNRNFFTPTVSVNDWFRRRFAGSKGSSAGVLVLVSGSTACKVGLVMTETPVLKVFERTAYPARAGFSFWGAWAAGGVGRAHPDGDGWIGSSQPRALTAASRRSPAISTLAGVITIGCSSPILAMLPASPSMSPGSRR